MRFFGSALVGLCGQLIEIKAQVKPGSSGALLVGLPGAIVKDGWSRAKGAIEESGFRPIGRLGLSFDLSPSEFPKNDPTLDLPLAVMALLARCQVPVEPPPEPDDDASDEEVEEYFELVEDCDRQNAEAQQILTRAEQEPGSVILVGNLDMTTGELRRPHAAGVLTRLLSLVDVQLERPVTIIVPSDCEAEVSLLLDRLDADIYKAEYLRDAFEIALLGKPGDRVNKLNPKTLTPHGDAIPDLNEIDGLATAKEAAEIAVAGGHHILFYGPAGEGKSLLAKAMLGILPRLKEEEFFEVNKIWDAAGLLRPGTLRYQRPIREISSSITEVALLGGGRRYPEPGGSL